MHPAATVTTDFFFSFFFPILLTALPPELQIKRGDSLIGEERRGEEWGMRGEGGCGGGGSALCDAAIADFICLFSFFLFLFFFSFSLVKDNAAAGLSGAAITGRSLQTGGALPISLASRLSGGYGGKVDRAGGKKRQKSHGDGSTRRLRPLAAALWGLKRKDPTTQSLKKKTNSIFSRLLSCV